MLFDTHGVPIGTPVRGRIRAYTDQPAKPLKQPSHSEANPSLGPKASPAAPPAQNCPNGICIGGENSGTATVNNTFSDKFPRPGVIPNITMCVTHPTTTKEVITIKSDTAISSPYWWFMLDGPVSDSAIELADAKEPFGSTHGPANPEQAASMHVPADHLVGVALTFIGPPFGGPWRPFEPSDLIRITLTVKNPVSILSVNSGSQRDFLAENIRYECPDK